MGKKIDIVDSGEQIEVRREPDAREGVHDSVARVLVNACDGMPIDVLLSALGRLPDQFGAAPKKANNSG